MAKQKCVEPSQDLDTIPHKITTIMTRQVEMENTVLGNTIVIF
jgi:hypothetical protein